MFEQPDRKMCTWNKIPCVS